jgi:endonuclease-3 related protein
LGSQAENLSRTLQEVFDRLFSAYGPQHWWPAEEPFEVIVGAILTQSTAWTNVDKAISNLKAKNALSPTALLDIPAGELAKLIRPSGYYNAKATKLKAFAHRLCDNYGSDLDALFSLDTDALRRELLSIHGVGDETADSIILYAANRPVFVIDAYTKRIICRLGLAPQKDSYDAYQALFTSNMPADERLLNEYHALLVRHGKGVCRKSPRCDGCCLIPLCRYKAQT